MKFKLLPINNKSINLTPTPSNVFTTYTLSGKPIPTKSDNSVIYNKIPVQNQGALGSCTIFALFNWDYFMRTKLGLPFQDLSESAEYYEELALIGHPGEDYGGYTWSAVGILEEFGAMLEQYDIYDNDNFKNPPPNEWLDSYKINATNAQKIQYNSKPEMIVGIKDALAQGYPILFGMMVYNQIYSAPNGVIKMSTNSDQPIGGHELVGIDFDENMTSPVNPGITGYVKFRNSWGNWGDSGNGWVPFDYLYQNVLEGFVVGVLDSVPQPKKDYTLSVTTDKTTYNVGDLFNINIQTSEPNQKISVNFTRPSVKVPFIANLSTNANGILQLPFVETVSGQFSGTVVWISPNGVQQTKTISIQITTPQPKPTYTLSVKLDKATYNVNESFNAIITTSTPKQVINVTLSEPNNITIPMTLTTNDSGVFSVPVKLSIAGDFSIKVTWKDPNGDTQNASASCKIIDNNPQPTNNYQLTVDNTSINAPINTDLKINVKLTNNGAGVANQAIQSIYSSILSGGCGATTSSDGIATFTVNSSTVGNAIAKFIWFNAGTQYSVVVNVNFVDSQPNPTPTPSSKLYHIQTVPIASTKTDEINALKTKLKETGYSNTYTVISEQIVANSTQELAQANSDKLTKQGIANIILYY